MNQLGIVHPSMLTRLTPLAYPSSCTIQYDRNAVQDIKNSYGQIIPDWHNLVGHRNLPCQLSASGGTETPGPEQIYLKSLFTIELAGNYPAITETMRAVVDGANYDITAVDQDSQNIQTRLSAKLVT